MMSPRCIYIGEYDTFEETSEKDIMILRQWQNFLFKSAETILLCQDDGKIMPM